MRRFQRRLPACWTTTRSQPLTLQDAGKQLEEFVANKKYEPAVIPALQQEITDIRNEASSYGSLGGVPAEMQANVRNQMYVTSESLKLLAKSGPKMSAGDTKIIANYKGFLDKSTRFIPTWVKVAVALALGLGTMVGWKRIVVTVGREDRQDAPDVCAGCFGGDHGDVHDRAGGWAGAAGEYDACAELRRGGDDDGQPKRAATVDGAGYCAGVGVYASGGGFALGMPVLGVQ